MSESGKTSAHKLCDDDKVSAHLANERTFLAWIRTGVALMGFGVLISKLKYMSASVTHHAAGLANAASIGIFFAAVGVITIIMSVIFFITTQNAIRKGEYIAGIGFVVITALLTGALGLVILWDLQLQ